LLLAAGCRGYPQRPIVDEVEIGRDLPVDTDPLLEGLATAETPLLFGVIPRVLEYSTYDPAVLAKDLERIERWFRARGYYEAKVTAARVVHLDERYVRVEIEVRHGPLVIVKRVDPAGIALLPLEVAGPAVSSISMRAGDVFDEAEFEADKRALLRVLTDGGYAFAKVKANARVDIARRSADIDYAVELGPRARLGAITIVGERTVPDAPVFETLGLEADDPYSTQEIEDAQKALVNLGVFASVEIVEDRSHPETGRVPLTVRVRESKLRTIRLGGGTRFDVLRLSAHLRTGWEDRNFLGGMRRFSVDARPGLTFFPTRVGRFERPTRVLPEFRARTELRQPSFLEGRTTGSLSGEFNVYPVLYPLPDDVQPDDEPILGYNEIKARAGVERPFFGHHLTVAPSYNWQANFPFAYQGKKSGLGPVRVSFPELFAALDFRDNPIQPTRGFYLSNSFEVAGYWFRGTVDDVRVKPEIRAYTRGALGRRSVFAARLAFGFLFPGNYGATLDRGSSEGGQAELDPTDPAVVSDQQKLLFRAFYSGGPSSNRGYPIRSVGPQGPIGYLVPSNLSGANCSIENQSIDELPAGCIRPLGGLTLWEFSLETRFPISGPFEGAVFVDMSDLTREVGQIRLDVPHISPGFGLRYVTPVGPLRLDLGFRPPYLQAIGQKELAREDGEPGSPFLGFLPMSLYLAIGEAF
jgi:outer membrane protein insertion porin family/translocation and assembly module TamA